ncbi:MAG: sporulation protein YqfC [Sulfobacillus acidophilus]|uniref:Sporulation protein YqfC n=1 Tax=Sulfobacillus acidophilus TaxID=53633 RepID=A0A2T2WN13_9FIRM|nr:MAG: sporulation protein YqfC [Sulfobacillus acidophilus]
MSERGRTVQRVTEMLEIPPEVLVNVPRVEVVGHLQFRVENHRGLEQYQPHRIVLRIPDGHLIVTGHDLIIGWIDRNEILVTGPVRSLIFRTDRV